MVQNSSIIAGTQIKYATADTDNRKKRKRWAFPKILFLLAAFLVTLQLSGADMGNDPEAKSLLARFKGMHDAGKCLDDGLNGKTQGGIAGPVSFGPGVDGEKDTADQAALFPNEQVGALYIRYVLRIPKCGRFELDFRTESLPKNNTMMTIFSVGTAGNTCMVARLGLDMRVLAQASTKREYVTLTSEPVAFGKWHHLQYWYGPAGSVLVIDGVIADYTTDWSVPYGFDINNVLYLGDQPWDAFYAGDNFVGRIDNTCLVKLDSLDAKSPPSGTAEGPLRVHPTNPRYFTDGSGKALYLTGSHTWDTFQRWSGGAPEVGGLGTGKASSFTAYLDVLQSHQHNFVRLWVADTAWSPTTQAAIEPQPYVRTGPGAGADGRPKFDLSHFNQAYFDMLRSQVIAARDRGIYVSVMLFDGWGISEYRSAPNNTTWNYHPFNAANNINGINGDPNKHNIGTEYHTLQVAAITAHHEAYVRKIVDTVNDLDNVLYEICNESGNYSTAWQYHLISFIKSYEATKPKRHPVGMTYQYSDLDSGTNANLFNSLADWIAPGAEGNYWDDPPAATGAKVIITDTDHINSKSSDATWIWRSFLRGLNPIVMDWWNGVQWDPIRRAMGQTRMYATKVDLSAMTPQKALSSKGYCLASPGSEYLVYQPVSKTAFTLDRAAGAYEFEWFDTSVGIITATGSFSIQAGNRSFTAPYKGEAVLYVRRSHP